MYVCIHPHISLNWLGPCRGRHLVGQKQHTMHGRRMPQQKSNHSSFSRLHACTVNLFTAPMTQHNRYNDARQQQCSITNHCWKPTIKRLVSSVTVVYANCPAVDD